MTEQEIKEKLTEILNDSDVITVILAFAAVCHETAIDLRKGTREDKKLAGAYGSAGGRLNMIATQLRNAPFLPKALAGK